MSFGQERVRYVCPKPEHVAALMAGLTVTDARSAWYQYPDLTAQTEALFRFVEQTIERDLPEELEYLRSYDRTKRLMQGVVDLPDRRLDLFIRLCNRNGGKLSAAKREGQFAMLTDEEIKRLQDAVREGFSPNRLPE